MDLNFLAPFVVSVTIAALTAASSRMRYQTIGDADYYKYPPYVGYMMIGGSVLAAWGCTVHDVENPYLHWISLFFAVVFACLAPYFFHYRMILTADTLTVGAFFRSRIPLAEVFDTDMIEGSRSRELVIYVRDGRRIRISGILGDIDDLNSDIRFKMANHGKADSPEKLHDRTRRDRFSVIIAVLLIGFLVALFYFVHWANSRLIR